MPKSNPIASLINLFKTKKNADVKATGDQKYDIIFHIGAPKTGSSAIQKYLLENRLVLQQYGYYYPEHGLDQNGISGGQSILGRKLMDGESSSAKAILNTYIAEAKQHNCTLLISAESLFNKAIQLKELTGDLRVKIIAFFRDPLESIYSNYNQGIKRHFSTARLEPFCKNILDKPADFYTGEIFNKWADLFGLDNLTIIKYDSAVFSQRPIQNIFLDFIGINQKKQKKLLSLPSEFINRSYNNESLELKRLFNHILDQKETRLNNEIDWFLQSISDKCQKSTFTLNDRLKFETYQKLKDKFSDKEHPFKGLLISLEAGTASPPSLQRQFRSVNQIELYKDMADIIIKLKNQKPKVFSYIYKQLNQAIALKAQSYEIYKLAELFNYDINQFYNQETWFNNNQLEKMHEYQLADFYRDIAYLCYNRGDLNHAQLLIEEARKIRPNGPAIIALIKLLNDR